MWKSNQYLLFWDCCPSAVLNPYNDFDSETLSKKISLMMTLYQIYQETQTSVCEWMNVMWLGLLHYKYSYYRFYSLLWKETPSRQRCRFKALKSIMRSFFPWFQLLDSSMDIAFKHCRWRRWDQGFCLEALGSKPW